MNKRFGTFPVPDSREGWIVSIRLLEEQTKDPDLNIQFNTRKIKPEGKSLRWEGIVRNESSRLPQL